MIVVIAQSQAKRTLVCKFTLYLDYYFPNLNYNIDFQQQNDQLQMTEVLS